MHSKVIISSLVGLFLAIIVLLITGYYLIFGLNAKTSGEATIIYISDSSDYNQVVDSLSAHLLIKFPKVLNWVAQKKKYPELIKPGRYIIDRDMSYAGLINMLRSGNQAVVNVTFNNLRTLNELAGKVSQQIEADSAQIISFLKDPENYSSDGFNHSTIISVFIPNTYQFYWNTSAKGFYARMLKEYKAFWNQERITKAREKNLNLIEVSILASIVDDEVIKVSEKPKIAGVYLNRLKRGIPLQACPTIKFALNDFTITRVLTKYLTVESPYNTYKYSGFPPGPIGFATIEGIDAVLNAESHDYLFFAAKADFSGYHNFSRTLAEHNRYAAEYQKELNRRKIFN